MVADIVGLLASLHVHEHLWPTVHRPHWSGLVCIYLNKQEHIFFDL